METVCFHIQKCDGFMVFTRKHHETYGIMQDEIIITAEQTVNERGFPWQLAVA
jgi:hypothetical protein